MVPLVLAFLLVACSSNTPETSAETTLPTATDSGAPQETVPEDTEPESIKLAPIIQISTNWTQVAALRSDGTVSVVAEESWSFGQCDTETWTDVIDICTGYSHTVGLRSDGTVYAAGTNSYNQCDVADWVDIVAIAAGYDFTIGLVTAARERGFNIPDDLDIFGFDCVQICTMMNPPLPVVHQPEDEIGVTAATYLIQRLSGYTGAPRQTKLKCRLVEK